jgi:hypothetical protein
MAENCLDQVLENFWQSPEAQAIPSTEQSLLQSDQPTIGPLLSLKEKLRFYLFRYLTQKLDGNNPVNPEELTNVISQGLSKYAQIYTVDIPYYDQLYAEFDQLRSSNDYPLEVYLGRDGIYAYVGRKAQDETRIRHAPYDQRSRIRQTPTLSIKPHYLVYPRTFRDSQDIATKQAYLRQHNILLEQNPYFYDTGFTGTIPEQIMLIMGFPPQEVEQRMKLLSADQDKRRLRSIPENARFNIINAIEDNAKMVDSATGLVLTTTPSIKDGVTVEEAVYQPIAEPTTPEEQFWFLMVREALSRHYQIKESARLIVQQQQTKVIHQDAP